MGPLSVRNYLGPQDFMDRKRSRGEKVLRVMGYCLAVAGVAVLAIVLRVRGGLSYFQIADGLEVPAVIPGIVVALLGCVLAWVNRLGRANSRDAEKIDVKPITEWVRAFERHQADLEFRRLSELYHGRPLAKYEPTSLDSPDASNRKSAA
jgi:hypothetical protein